MTTEYDTWGRTLSISVLPNLQFGCREYQHLQCETHIFPCFSEKKLLYLPLKKTFLP